MRDDSDTPAHCHNISQSLHSQLQPRWDSNPLPLRPHIKSRSQLSGPTNCATLCICTVSYWYSDEIIYFKVRKIVKKFRKSSRYNDQLQRDLEEAEKSQVSLILDTRTRWNSLVKMLSRYLELREAVDNILKDLAGGGKY